MNSCTFFLKKNTSLVTSRQGFHEQGISLKRYFSSSNVISVSIEVT